MHVSEPDRAPTALSRPVLLGAETALIRAGSGTADRNLPVVHRVNNLEHVAARICAVQEWVMTVMPNVALIGSTDPA